VRAPHQPDSGDLVWMDFSPHAGTEQGGRRPGLVLSPKPFNIATGLAIVCPITSKVKGGSFEVPLPSDTKLGGVALCDHVRSTDWLARNAEFHAKAPPQFLNTVLATVAAIIGL
jgi:mRNA interferase MazF